MFGIFKKRKEHTPPPAANYWKLCGRILSGAHVLIAGATGCGKSVFLNSVMWSLLANPGKGLALYLIDPKRVELCGYRDLQFTKGYVHSPEKVVTMLNDVVRMMECRYAVMQAQGSKSFTGGTAYVVIDELADLMISQQKREIRELLQKILQLGRAADIHIIACTQAPSRRIIPAELTLNFTDRVALRCQSSIESKQIIGISGAEKLPRHGKGIYSSPDGIELVDIPMTDEAELAERIDWYLKQR